MLLERKKNINETYFVQQNSIYLYVQSTYILLINMIDIELYLP